MSLFWGIKVDIMDVKVIIDKRKSDVYVTKGKHKGKEVSVVANEDRGYLTWMRKNMDLDEDLQFTLDYYLN